MRLKMKTDFSILHKERGGVFLTLRQRFLQDVVFGLKFGNEVAALEILAKFLRSKNRRRVSSEQVH